MPLDGGALHRLRDIADFMAERDEASELAGTRIALESLHGPHLDHRVGHPEGTQPICDLVP